MSSIVRHLAPVAAAAALCLGVLSVSTPASAQVPPPAPAPPVAGPRIAVIDLRRAVIETEEGLRVQATLKKLFDSRQVELSSKERQLQGELEELEKEARAGKSNAADIARKRDGLQRQYAGLQQTLVEYQREMQRKEGEMTQPMVARVLGLIKRVATTDGFDAVLEKSAVPYIRADLDLTDRVIQMFNAGQGDPAGAPKPGAAPKPAAPRAPAPAPKK